MPPITGNHLQLLSRRRIQETTPNFINAGTVSIDLSQTSLLDAISIIVYGSQTVAAAITAVTVAGMYNLIDKVELVVNGKTIFSLRGFQLMWLYQISSKNRPLFTDVANPGAGNAFSYQLAALLPLNDFMPYFSMLDSTISPGGIRELKLKITWAATTTTGTCYTTASTITNTTGPTVEVHTERLVGGELTPQGRPQPGSIGYRYLWRSLISEQTLYAGAASSSFKIRLSPKRRYSRLMLFTMNSAGSGIDTVLSNAKITNDNDVIFDMTRREIQRVQYDRYNVTASDQTTYYPGIYTIDFAKPGLYNETDWAGNEMYLQLNLNAVANATLHMVSDTFVNNFGDL